MLKKFVGTGRDLSIINLKILLFICLILLINISVFASQVKIVDFGVNKGETTNISFVLTGKANYKVFYLGAPSRVVIDVRNAALATKFRKALLAHTQVKNIRIGRHPGKLRIVLDLHKKTFFRHSLVWNNGVRKFILTVTLADFRKVKNKTASQTRAKQTVLQKTVVQQKVSSKKTAAKIPPVIVSQIKAIAKHRAKNAAATKGVLAKISTKKTYTRFAKVISKISTSLTPVFGSKIPRARMMRDVIIVIDPGHGGKDPGVTGVGGIQEKNVVFVIAKYLQQYLNQQMGFRAILTRNGDNFLYLRERLQVAHDNRADMFISLHADAYKGSYFYKGGASVFALSRNGATSVAARWLAERENESELGQLTNNHSMELRSLLIGLEQNATIKRSLAIGQVILPELAAVTKLHQYKIEQAAFVVLRSPDIPSLLVETGFLSDKTGEKKLSDVNYDKKLAYALAQGIKQYFIQNPPPGTYLAAMKQTNSYKWQNTLGAALIRNR